MFNVLRKVIGKTVNESDREYYPGKILGNFDDNSTTPILDFFSSGLKNISDHIEDKTKPRVKKFKETIKKTVFEIKENAEEISDKALKSIGEFLDLLGNDIIEKELRKKLLHAITEGVEGIKAFLEDAKEMIKDLPEEIRVAIGKALVELGELLKDDEEDDDEEGDKDYDEDDDEYDDEDYDEDDDEDDDEYDDEEGDKDYDEDYDEDDDD